MIRVSESIMRWGCYGGRPPVEGGAQDHPKKSPNAADCALVWALPETAHSLARHLANFEGSLRAGGHSPKRGNEKFYAFSASGNGLRLKAIGGNNYGKE
ncbi:MAG: hypothetical protein WC966_03865 [Bradymonadales bacterium]|jgi:hypothetical protein